MAITSLLFSDSFGHYDDTSLKWTIAGGSISTANPRTGTRCLDIGASAGHPGAATYGNITVGAAFRVPTEGTLQRTLLDALNTDYAETTFSLRQEVDGAVSLLVLGAVVATSVPGVMVAEKYTYLEVAVHFFQEEIHVFATGEDNITAEILNQPIVVPNPYVQVVMFGGTAGGGTDWEGKIADVYLAAWDGADPKTLSAPRIYCCMPIEDGHVLIGAFSPVQTDAFADAGAPGPYVPLVSAVPEDTSTFIEELEVVVDDVEQGMNICGRAFKVDVSGVPPGSTIAALQCNILYQFSAGETTALNFADAGVLLPRTNESDPINWWRAFGQNQPVNVLDFPNETSIYKFAYSPNVADDNGLPFDLADFTGPSAWQFGPWVGQSS